MKKLIAGFMCLCVLIGACACAPTQSSAPDLNAAETAKEWIEDKIDGNGLFSFDYDGKEYSSFISSWDKKVETGTTDDGKASWTVTYTSLEAVALRAEITFDEEYAALDWCCYFDNGGSADSPVISNIQAVNSKVDITNPVLTCARGSTASAQDFEPYSIDFAEKDEYSMRSEGGRSSSGCFPYFDIANGEYGVMGAIGWTGNWQADFTCADGGVNITAGMHETRISLHAAESMRTPRIVLQFFTGDQDAGHNQFRRLVLKSYTLTDETGVPLTHLPFVMVTWGGTGVDGELTNMGALESAGQFYDVLTLDAGWYGIEKSVESADLVWYNETGNWFVNEELYPEGFTPISEALNERGKKLCVWFEPERAMPGTLDLEENAEHYLPATEGVSFRIYNLASDEATDALIDRISSVLNENDISWYRQDFNCSPYDTWRANDELESENRVGITEIKYITNLYRYFEGLCEKCPGLLIDNCASGGRRLDIEMMKRSVPLWRTDYNVASNTSANTDGCRSINYNLTWWLPLSGGGGSRDGTKTAYKWRATQGSAMLQGPSSNDVGWRKTMTVQYETCRELMTGDYYILAEGLGSDQTRVNAVYEFYLPEKGEGYIMAFRPSGSPTAEDSYRLKGLDAEADYELKVEDTGEIYEATGEKLMRDGLKITFENTELSFLIYITKK